VARFHEPLIVPCAGLAAGIVAARYARFDTPEWIAAFSLFAFAVIVCRLRAPRCAWIAYAGCAVALGIATAEFHRRPPAPAVDAESGETLLVSGCVVEPLSVQDGRGRFTIEIEPNARAAVTFRITPGEPPPSVLYGSMVEFPARVRTPRNYGNPGAFDYVGYLARRDAFWLASVQSHAPIQKLPGKCGSAFTAALVNFRESALARLDTILQNEPKTEGFMRALLLGDDDRLDQNTSEEFRRTGTYHAIVISGLHISLVAGTLLWLMRRLFLPLYVRLLIALFATWVYTLMAGGQAPVTRAALGFTLALVAAAAHRRVRVLNILAVVAIAFLLYDPDQLFEASFELSFAAVAAIGALAAPVLDLTSARLRSAARDLDYVRPSRSIHPKSASLRVELRLFSHTLMALFRTSRRVSKFLVENSARSIAIIWEMVILSGSVQFALTVPAVVYFHRVPVTSVFANLLAVPLLNGAVGFGLTGLIAGSAVLTSVAGTLVRMAEATVSAFARLEPNSRCATPPASLAIAFLVALIVTAAALRKRPRLSIAPAAISVCLALLMYFHQDRPTAEGWLEFSAIDVGQGDSLLIGFPDGRTMLVDGGGFPSFKGNPVRRMDIGEQVVAPYLWNRGLRHIDVVAMTHTHDDHAQGLSAILRDFSPGEFWTGVTPGVSADGLLALAGKSGARVVQPRAGYTRKFGPVNVQVLAPAQDYSSTGFPRNNDSLVLEITYGVRRFVLTGDAERPVESDLVAKGLLGHADVLKVGHHGSKTSTIPDLLNALRPMFAVISVGDGNLYGHPHPDVVERLQEAHVQTFRTDRAGLTSFRIDGKVLHVETNGFDWRAN
jgi:competence protein ComEC